MQVPIFMNQV